MTRIATVQGTGNDALSSPGGEESQAEWAYKRIEEMIVSLALAPGTLVTESRLGEMLGIGRTPIREALQRLAREHLVNVLPRRGIQVSEVDTGEQLLLLEVRRHLERCLAAGAARRATADERQAFADMADAMEAAAERGDEMAFLRLDRRFNRMMSECARNPFAYRAATPLHALSRRFWTIHLHQELDMPVGARRHAAIMRAIAEGDEAAAIRASDALLDYVEAFTRQIHEEGTAPDGA